MFLLLRTLRIIYEGLNFRRLAWQWKVETLTSDSKRSQDQKHVLSYYHCTNGNPSRNMSIQCRE